MQSPTTNVKIQQCLHGRFVIDYWPKGFVHRTMCPVFHQLIGKHFVLASFLFFLSCLFWNLNFTQNHPWINHKTPVCLRFSVFNNNCYKIETFKQLHRLWIVEREKKKMKKKNSDRWSNTTIPRASQWVLNTNEYVCVCSYSLFSIQYK